MHLLFRDATRIQQTGQDNIKQENKGVGSLCSLLSFFTYFCSCFAIAICLVVLFGSDQQLSKMMKRDVMLFMHKAQ